MSELIYKNFFAYTCLCPKQIQSLPNRQSGNIQFRKSFRLRLCDRNNFISYTLSPIKYLVSHISVAEFPNPQPIYIYLSTTTAWQIQFIRCHGRSSPVCTAIVGGYYGTSFIASALKHAIKCWALKLTPILCWPGRHRPIYLTTRNIAPSIFQLLIVQLRSFVRISSTGPTFTGNQTNKSPQLLTLCTFPVGDRWKVFVSTVIAGSETAILSTSVRIRDKYNVVNYKAVINGIGYNRKMVKYIFLKIPIPKYKR